VAPAWRRRNSSSRDLSRDIRVFAAIKNRTLVDIERATGDIDRTTLDIRVSVGAE
jgi:hypothetical protein